MPHRKNAKGDIGSLKRFSDTYDMDNVYLSEEGWVYRHFKKADKSVWWDEILVAGQVKEDEVIHNIDNAPLCLTNPDKLGVKVDPVMEVGDNKSDIDYSDHVGAPPKVTTYDNDDESGVPLSDRYDYQETAWSSINVPDGTVYKNPDGTQVPLGWSGVSSPSQDPDDYPTASPGVPPVTPDPKPPAGVDPGVPVQQDE